MKIEIEQQEVEIDMDELAYRLANGDLISFGNMLFKACEYMRVRDRNCGNEYLKSFDYVFGIFLKEISSDCVDKIFEIIKEE